jgi:hypothetical protein
MVDRYTKAVLTVIAAALVALAIQQAVPSASAASDCGTRSYDPCYVKIVE